jgi:ethanolamine transporter EutH
VNKNERVAVTTKFAIFFVIGLAIGIVEDLIAIYFATGAVITLEVVKIAALVALPFAIISEIFVDLHLFKTLIKKRFNQHDS